MDEFIDAAVTLYLALFDGAGLAWFAGRLASPRYASSRWVCAAAVAAVRLAAVALSPAGGGSGPSAVRLCLVVVCACALCMLLFGPGFRRPLYAALCWSALLELSFFLAYTAARLTDPVYGIIGDAYLTSGAEDPDQYLRVLTVTARAVQMLTLGVLSVLQIVSCRFISSRFPARAGDISGTEFRLLCLPCFTGLLLAVLLRTLMITMDNGVPTLLFERSPAVLFLIPAICAVALVSIVYAAGTCRDMADMEAAEQRGRIAEERLRALKAQVIETERANGRVRKIRHDLNNTLTVIRGLADNLPDASALQDYLADLTRDINETEHPFQTGDPVADILLAAKYRDVLDQAPGTQFDAYAFAVPPDMGISSYALGILLGNALDNALHAVADKRDGERFIRLRSTRRGDLFGIYVENSCRPGALRTNADGLPVSTRPDGHGIGLASIRDLAERHGGGMDWRKNGGVFTLAVMLREEREG